jgi:hypothetical protein
MRTKQDLFNYDGHINTRSNIRFSLFDPKPEQIEITDISHGLAYKAHFGGQTPQYFSIAQHCLLVVDFLPIEWRLYKPEIVLAALLHDAAEAYIGDMIKPLKIHLPKFVEVEDKIQSVIFEKFDLKMEYMSQIKKYDKLAQEYEFEVFYEGNKSLTYFSPDLANDVFMIKFNELIKQIIS